MSWSFNAIGKPENVAAALDKHSETLSGQSKVEFDDAKPHLAALVRQNFIKDGSGYTLPIIILAASGSGCARGSQDAPEQIQRNITVKLETMYGNLV